MRKHPVLGRIAGYVFAIVFILAGWQLTAMAVHNPVLPGPFDAFPMVAQYFDELWPAFLVSLYRVVVAMLIGAVLIYEGLSDLWTIFRVSQWTKEYRKHHPVDVDQIDFE